MSLVNVAFSVVPRNDPCELDLRALPPPEPLIRALAAADALAPGKAVCVLTPLLPTPLLEALSARGMHHFIELLPEGGARVLINRPQDDDKTSA